MQLQDNEYCISIFMKDDSCKEAIVITKEALEKLRDHYLMVADECHYNSDTKSFYYVGKADVLIDILKHFDDGISER